MRRVCSWQTKKRRNLNQCLSCAAPGVKGTCNACRAKIRNETFATRIFVDALRACLGLQGIYDTVSVERPPAHGKVWR